MFKVHKIKMRKRRRTNLCSRCIDCDFKKFATIETETKKKGKRNVSSNCAVCESKKSRYLKNKNWVDY